ncbi:hypothetical protein LCGC14_0221490 [marine sediment metagenome]|uniref:Uncharacterized protein n=1 Tax=marine sediment metagenome TaxID=412755 RepID=A0A0F9WXZ4_9ZZZZ
MTFDEFKLDFLNFLDGSNVNLGRRGTKTRSAFLDKVLEKFETFSESCNNVNVDKNKTKKKDKNPMSGSVKCIKPEDPRKALDIGKGVHAMTSSESMRADEQLDRSPFSGKNDEDKENE